VLSTPGRRRFDSYRVHHTQGNTFLGASNDPWDPSFDRGIRHFGNFVGAPVPPAWRSITFCFALLGCRLSLHPLSDVPVALGCDSSCGKIAESRYDPTAKMLDDHNSPSIDSCGAGIEHHRSVFLLQVRGAKSSRSCNSTSGDSIEPYSCLRGA
jgi:hypothetical protein